VLKTASYDRQFAVYLHFKKREGGNVTPYRRQLTATAVYFIAQRANICTDAVSRGRYLRIEIFGSWDILGAHNQMTLRLLKWQKCSQLLVTCE